MRKLAHTSYATPRTSRGLSPARGRRTTIGAHMGGEAPLIRAEHLAPHQLEEEEEEEEELVEVVWVGAVASIQLLRESPRLAMLEEEVAVEEESPRLVMPEEEGLRLAMLEEEEGSLAIWIRMIGQIPIHHGIRQSTVRLAMS